MAWQEWVFYQVYPRSFQDGNGDGVGDLGDFDRLLAAVHERGLRLFVDLVPNHTSDRHPWFVEARSSCRHPRRDWYVWRDPGPAWATTPRPGRPAGSGPAPTPMCTRSFGT